MKNIIVGGRYSFPSLEMTLEVEVVKIVNSDEAEIKIIKIIEIAGTISAKELQKTVTESIGSEDITKVFNCCLEPLRVL
jgi:hypothetical protein